MTENAGNKSRITTQHLTQGAIIAGLYVALSLILQPITYNQIQCRIAEALCMTIYYTPAGAWGVCVGCFITNLYGGSWIDIVFGTMATVIAVILTLPIAKNIRKKCGTNLDYKHSLLIPIPTVLVNALIIPFVLYYGFQIQTFDWGSYSFTAKSTVFILSALSIAVGQILACYVFGPIIVKVMSIVGKRKDTISE